MATSWHHAVSSAQKWGGVPEDYLHIHTWFDESKMHWADFRHRALRHHTEGIFMCEKIFGPVLINSAKKEVPTRWIGEQHVKEDCGFIPTIQDWFENITPKRWMGQPPSKLACEETLEPMKYAEV